MYKYNGKYLLKRKINHIQQTLKQIERYRRWALPPQPVNIKGVTSFYKISNKNAAKKLKIEDLKCIRSKVMRNHILTYCNNLKLRNTYRPYCEASSKMSYNHGYGDIKNVRPTKETVIHKRSLMKPKSLLYKKERKMLAQKRLGTTEGSKHSNLISKDKKRDISKKQIDNKSLLNKKYNRINQQESCNSDFHLCNEVKMDAVSVSSDKTLTENNALIDLKSKKIIHDSPKRSIKSKNPLKKLVKKKNESKSYKNKQHHGKLYKSQKRIKAGADVPNSTNDEPNCQSSAIKIQPTFKIPKVETDYNSIMDCYRVKSRYPLVSPNMNAVPYKPFESSASDVFKSMLANRASRFQVNYMQNIECSNKRKFYSYDKQKLDNSYAEEIRLAVLMGNSRDPFKNEILNRVLTKALNDKISWAFIDNILADCKSPKIGSKKIHVLQIQLHSKIFVICTVYTNDFPNLVAALENVMRRHNARFATIIDHFTHCCVIEAIAPYRGKNENDLKNYLQKVAVSMGAKSIDIVDYETLEVCLKCQPEQMGKIADTLIRKGYKILDLDFGFRPKELISLNDHELQNYHRFITYLQMYTNFETITDNVM